MRIVELRAENLKRLKAVEIKPDGDVVVIAGRNAQGKSSVLDAIWMALAGAAGAKETTRPIRDGEKQASVDLDLGDLVVSRRWTEKGTTLTVAAADGAKYPSPQKVLDELIGRLTFDPLAFADASQKEQLATLLSVVELPFDPEKLAMERQAVYDQRTDVNREARRLEALITDLPDVPEGTPETEISASALATQLEAALADATEREAMETKINEMRERVRRLSAELSDAESALNDLVDQYLQRTMRAPVDPEPLREQIAEADATNVLVRAKKERAHLAKTLKDTTDQADTLTTRLDDIDERKAQALQEANMPLEGLSFDEERVLFKGIPLSQVSDSERLRVSIAIAMALNPKIRVIRITDGSLLDSENMGLIAEMASEHDFQIWIERVDESGEVGITIEDGQVA